MTASKEWCGDRLVVRFEGTFDPAAEWGLHSILAETTGCPVKVDFARVRDFQDIAVAMLARDLAQSGQRVELLGLRDHQLAILRNFGIDMRDEEPPSESA